MTDNAFSKLPGILKQLQQATIFYSLMHAREDAIMVQATVPGQRWEIEVFSDGTVEIEVFTSDGIIHDETYFEQLLMDFRE